MSVPTPLVTVVIPAFNAAETITRAVDSALAQTFADYEIIIIDDASTDATAEVVVSQYGERVTLLRLPQNLGESGAMNAGIVAARGELIAFLDADDAWLPGKLARQVTEMQQRPACSIVVCGCRFIKRAGKASRDDVVGILPVAPDEVWRLLLARTLIAKPCVLARARALHQAGPFDTTLAVGADQDMWIRLALVGSVILVPEILTIAYDTAGSLTKVYADKIDRYMLPMIGRHVDAQRHRLSRREIREIWGERYTSIGRNLYAAGSFGRGAALILQGISHGHSIGSNLWYLLTASRPVRTLKRLISPLMGGGEHGLSGNYTA